VISHFPRSDPLNTYALLTCIDLTYILESSKIRSCVQTHEKCKFCEIASFDKAWNVMLVFYHSFFFYSPIFISFKISKTNIPWKLKVCPQIIRDILQIKTRKDHIECCKNVDSRFFFQKFLIVIPWVKTTCGILLWLYQKGKPSDTTPTSILFLLSRNNAWIDSAKTVMDKVDELVSLFRPYNRGNAAKRWYFVPKPFVLFFESTFY